MLTFDPGTNVYRWNGRIVPNVTRIIAPLTDYSRIDPVVLDRAKAQGSAIHRMVELDCRNDLDTESLPDWMLGYYSAWCRFKEDSGLDVWACEERMYHDGLGYAGTADLIGIAPKLAVKRGIVIDVKRSLYAGPVIGLQTAAYKELWNHRRERLVVHRAALVLKADGSYRLALYEDHDDWVAFLACLQQYKWKEKHYGKSD